MCAKTININIYSLSRALCFKNLCLFSLALSLSCTHARAMRHLKIRRFNPASLKLNRIILITGKRGTGKTTMVKHLIHSMRHYFHLGVGIGGTVASTEMLESFLPKSLVYQTTDTSVIENLVRVAKLTKEHGKVRNFLLVLDDFSYRKDLLRQPVFREIFMNGRNFNLTLILSAQYIMDLQTDLRSQIDYVFTFRELIKANRKRLHEYFYGMVDDIRDFEQILHEFTCNFECLVMDNTGSSGDIENQLYFYKAPEDTPSFMVGSPVYWSLDATCRRTAQSPNGSLFYRQLSKTAGSGGAVTSIPGGDGAAASPLAKIKGTPENKLVISRLKTPMNSSGGSSRRWAG